MYVNCSICLFRPLPVLDRRSRRTPIGGTRRQTRSRTVDLQLVHRVIVVLIVSNDVSVIAFQGLLDRGEAQTAAELSRGAAFVSRTRSSVRGSRLPGRSQVPVQEQTAGRSTDRVDATARESRRHFDIVSMEKDGRKIETSVLIGGFSYVIREARSSVSKAFFFVFIPCISARWWSIRRNTTDVRRPFFVPRACFRFLKCSRRRTVVFLFLQKLK